MNNRFKEIAHEATLWCEQHAKGTPVAWEWEAKYAELIVEDCVQLISSMMDYTDYDTSDLQAVELKALRNARQLIKERFGIEAMSEGYQPTISACACMGPQGNDPVCPCAMRQRGLEPANGWTSGEVEKLHEVMNKYFRNTTQNDK